VNPAFVTRSRSNFGDIVAAQGGDTNSVAFAPHEKKVVVTTLPKAHDPQAYNVALTYGTSNVISYHYVIQGGSGTIQNILLDKDTYAKGETAHLSFMWSPSADGFPGSRQGTSTKLVAPSFTIVLTDEFKHACAAPFTKTLDRSDRLVSADIALSSSCVHPEANVTLTDAIAGTLSKLSFDTATTTPVVIPQTNTMTPRTALIALLALLLVALPLMLYLKKNRRSIPVTPLVLFFAVGMLFAHAETAQADTFGIAEYTFTVSLNKNSYTPSETMTISGSVTSHLCANSALLYELRYGVNAPATIVLLSVYLTGGSSTGISSVFASAPPVGGNYNVNFRGGIFILNDSGFQSYSLPFTVVSPPVVNLYFSLLKQIEFSMGHLFSALNPARFINPAFASVNTPDAMR
jgi:hypothetical protein